MSGRAANWKASRNVRDRFVQTLTELAETDRRITLITGDLGFGVLDSFRSKFPAQYINAGVAEQNMTLLATGLALEGRIVFTYSIANFPTLRCLEMVRNGPAYHDLPVKVVAIGGGFSYGSLGISHHATEDLAIMRALPGIDVFVPGGQAETDAATRALWMRPGTGYLRLDKDPGVDVDDGAPFEPGVPRRIAAGAGPVVLLASGGILSEAMAARKLLLADGIDAAVYSLHSLRPLQRQPVIEIVRRHPIVVAIEEHTIVGGLSSALLEVLADECCWPRLFIRVGLQDQFSSAVGSQAHLRQVYGLDAETIAVRVRSAMAQVSSQA
jgi:transketolase